MDFSNPSLHFENSNSSLVAYICDLVSENGLFKPIIAFGKLVYAFDEFIHAFDKSIDAFEIFTASPT